MTWLALRLLIGGKLRSAFGWITASSTHLLIVALAVAIAGGLWERHIVHKRDAQLARWPVIYAQERHSFRIERDSVNTLLAAIRTQNAAVQRMGEEGQRKQLAAASALSAAVARSAHGEVSALAIDRERSERGSNLVTGKSRDCKSGAAVMAAKGDL